MRRQPILSAASGLIIAAILIAGISLAGGGAVHIDLVKAQDTGAASNGLSGGTSLGSQASPPSAHSVSPPSNGRTVSALSGLTSQGGGAIGVLLLPILLGAVLGAVFYGAYARRVDVE